MRTITKTTIFGLTLSIAFALLAVVAGAVTISLDGTVLPSRVGVNSVSAGTGSIGFVDIEKVFNEHPLCKRSHEAFDAETVKRKTELKLLEVEISNFERIIVSSSTQLDTLKANLALLNKGIIPGAYPQVSTSTSANPHTTVLPGTTAQSMAPVTAPIVSAPVNSLPGMLPMGTTQAISASTSSAPVATTNIPQVVSSTVSSQSTNATIVTTASYTANSGTTTVSSDFRTLIASTLDNIKMYETDIETMKADVAKKKSNIADKLKHNKQELCDLEARQTDEVLQDIYNIVEKIAKELNINVILDRKDVLYGQPYQDLTDKVIERLQGR